MTYVPKDLKDGDLIVISFVLQVSLMKVYFVGIPSMAEVLAILGNSETL